MSFASTLDEYCKAVNCTNKDLALASGISASTLSRYRSGERMPESASKTVESLASGIAKLSLSGDSTTMLRESEVRSNLESSIAGTRMAGMDFNMRLDSIMKLTGIRNAKMAEATQVDPSYISRIRKGERTPANLLEFAEPASRLAARFCIDKGLINEAIALTGAANAVDDESDIDVDAESSLAETIGTWLLGDKIAEADVVEMDKLFSWLDTTDFSDWLALGNSIGQRDDVQQVTPKPLARFYYGIDGMRNAEIAFLDMAADTHARELSMSSDMPLLQMELDRTFVAKYKRGIARLLENGCRVNIVHGVERPLDETIRALRMWIPFYLTGFVTPYYLKGIHNRLFCHVNYVCDSCALASEAMIGHQEDGRYFFSTRPADVAYYHKKMGFILERASSMFAIYRDDDPEQRAAFERAQASRRMPGRRVGESQYKNLEIVSHASECAVLTLHCKPTTVHFIIRHPKISYALTRME